MSSCRGRGDRVARPRQRRTTVSLRDSERVQLLQCSGVGGTRHPQGLQAGLVMVACRVGAADRRIRAPDRQQPCRR